MMRLVCDVATQWGVDVPQMPVVGCAPEWMSEKAVSIGNYVVATGIDTFLGVVPYVAGSDVVSNLLQEGIKDWVGASYTFETDIEKLGDLMLENIEAKRLALGI
jgi:carbon-monoxide dehydrogenase catalytic subunit